MENTKTDLKNLYSFNIIKDGKVVERLYKRQIKRKLTGKVKPPTETLWKNVACDLKDCIGPVVFGCHANTGFHAACAQHYEEICSQYLGREYVEYEFEEEMTEAGEKWERRPGSQYEWLRIKVV